MSVEILAAAAVALVAPYLVELGKGAAKVVGGEVARPVLDWMRAKLGGPAKEALADLEQYPEIEDNLADLRKRLTKALEAEPALADELRALLPPSTVAQAGQMVQIVSGAGAAAVQNVGSENRINVRGGG